MSHGFYVSIGGPREGVKTGSAMLDQLITFYIRDRCGFQSLCKPIYVYALCLGKVPLSEVLAGHKCEHTIFFKYDTPVQTSCRCLSTRSRPCTRVLKVTIGSPFAHIFF